MSSITSKHCPNARTALSTSVKKRKRRKKRVRNIGDYQTAKGGICRFRSSWELQYFKYLDACPQVVSFSSEGLRIPYVSNVRTGKLRNYIPDLLVTYADGSRSLIEIKPKKRLSLPKNVKKFFAAREWCLRNGCSFVLITEIELKALGLI
jgi:hypothetical protein